MSSHQAAFEIISALITADTFSGSGLNNASSPNHLFGGVSRRGDPVRTEQAPWIEVEIAGEREQDGAGNDRMDLVLRLHLFTKRDTVFTTGAGNQNSIATRMRTIFHTVTGSTAQGWKPNMLYRTSGVQAPDDGNHAHYVETYLLRLSA